MTPDYKTLFARSLAMTVRWCEVGQKEHAWKLAKQLAELDPHHLGTLPEALKADQLRKKEAQRLNAQQTGSGGKSEHLDSSPTLARLPANAKPQQRQGMAGSVKATP